MAINLEGGCRVTQMREGVPVTNGTLKIWPQVGRAVGAKAISLRIMEFAPGLSPSWRNESADEVLYLLPGAYHDSASAQGGAPSATIFIDETEHAIEPDSGIYLRPGQSLAVNNSTSAPLFMVSTQCPDLGAVPELKPPPANINRAAATSKPAVVRLADRPSVPTADRWYRVLVDDEVGSSQVTQFVGSIPPGRAPDHFHQYEEVLFILRGEGRMWAGRTNTPIGVGSCVYLPRGQVHCVENTGASELRLLGVFYPAGSPSVRYET